MESVLLETTVVDVKDEFEQRLEYCFNILCGLTTGKSDTEVNDALNSHICKGPQQHEEIQNGLFYAVLSDPKNAAKHYRDATLTSRDGMSIIIQRANQIIHEKWLKLQDRARTQVVWLCRELVRNSVQGADSVIHTILRQIAGGDVSPKNVWLAENVLDLLTENRAWLDKSPFLIGMTVFTYLRLLVDHWAPNFKNLRQREVDLCVSLLTEKWVDCMLIGRDLVRMMQQVARIPELEAVWRDILHNPSKLHSTFTGVSQLMNLRTSRKFLMSRLTPDMENKLVFLTTKVKFGNHKRYQDWLQRQYLSTPESQSLRCDFIRYICAVIHPPNELLQSDVIPRWAVIGWLLTTCTSNVAASNAKLALFYDWFFYDTEKDNIMNIEPAILVIFHSMRPHPAITATLLDFLCRMMSNFYPPLSPDVKKGIFSALRAIVDKRVMQSLSPLFDNPKLDKELRCMIRDVFAEFCSPEIKDDSPMKEEESSVDVVEIAEFSEDEDDSNNEKVSFTNDLLFRPIKEPPPIEHIDITDQLPLLDEVVRNYVLQLQNEKDNESQCETMDCLVQAVLNLDDFDLDMATPLAVCLTQVMASYLQGNLLPLNLDDESIEDSMGTPIFVLFRNLCQVSEEDPSRHPLLLLLSEMCQKQARIGYYLLYYLKVGKVNDEKMTSYRDLCKSLEMKLETCILTHLQQSLDDDIRMFTFIIPDIYTTFPNVAIGNVQLLYLIVSSIDGRQLQDLVWQILEGHLIMFEKSSFLSVLSASLEWETVEQYFLWQLISAHNIPVEYIMPILPKLDYTAHAEALTSLLILLKQDSPAADILRPIICRRCKRNDLFTVSILKYWAEEYGDRLAELLHTQLTRQAVTPKRKQKQQAQNKNPTKEHPSVEQVLSHLDHMRQTCKNISFLTHELIQQGLTQAQQSCTDAQKNRFSDLLALAEDFEEVKTTRVLRGRRGSQMSPKRTKPKRTVENSSSSESSDEDEVLKPKAKKRRKAMLQEDSD